MHTNVLYYNTNVISDPPVTLDDLLTAARGGTGVALPRTFTDAYWGAPAYGASLFAEDGRLLLDSGGFADWLTWLEEMNTTPSVTMAADFTNRSAFIEGEAAYYVGPPEALAEIRAALGRSAVGTVTLPSGPAAPSAPILTTTAYVLSADLDDTTREIALDFGNYLTNVDSQTTLVNRALRVPANVNVSLDSNSNIATFRQQALQVTILPKIEQIAALQTWGSSVYRDVLDNGVQPNEAITALVTTVNEANGFVSTEVPITSTPETTDEATLTLTITPTITSEGE